MTKPKLLFVINSIGSGGAERVLDNILYAAQGRLDRYEVHLCLLDDAPERRAMQPVFGKHVLAANGKLGASITQLHALARRIQPDLIVSFLIRANVATAIAGRLSGTPTILCERMNTSSHLSLRYGGIKRVLLGLLPRLVYARASLILAVSEGVRQDLIHAFGIRPARVRTIYNPYDIDRLATAGAAPPAIALPDRFIVAVGRLVAAKGFDLLIDAFARQEAHPSLIILGEGPEHAALAARIAALGMADRITLAGFTPELFAIVARAQALVSASHNEGFPNAIAEAMALGLPVLATDCPSGPAELLGGQAREEGRATQAPYGLIVKDGDVAGLVDGLRLLEDPALRATYAAASRRRLEDFRIETIAAHYWTLFDDYLARRRPSDRP